MSGRYSMLEAANKLGVHKQTLYRWEKAGKIKKAPRLKRTGERVYSDELILEIDSKMNETIDPSTSVTG